MAEVVGLVVGVVSLGVQLAESVQKVKRFYSTVKDAPERLTDIIDEIESLSDILTEMEGDHTAYTTELGPKMQHCVATCRRAVDKFSTYADSLESRMRRHSRLGSVKFAMKSESIEGVISRLESSKSNLVLAYMLYREAVADKRALQMQQQMETMAVAQTLLLHQTPQPPVVLATPNMPNSHPQSMLLLRGKNFARLSSPKWLSRSVWELAVERAISGWTFSLRSYRVVPFGSPVTQACLNDDVVVLQQLFSRREASPFDKFQGPSCFTNDDSLLSTAVLFCKPEVARLLITTTGELLEVTAFDIEYSWRVWSVWASPQSDVKALQRHFSLLLEYYDSGGFEPSLDEVRTFAHGSVEDANLVLFWNEILNVSQHRSATERETKWSMLLNALILNDEIEYLVGNRAVDYLNCKRIKPSSAAHLLTTAYLASAVSGSYHGMSNARVLSKLVAEARHNGIDPLVCEDAAISPMLRLLHPEPSNSALSHHRGWKDLSAILSAWLSLLQLFGVDLAGYGEEEWRVFQFVRRKYECKRPWDDWHGTKPHSCYEDSIYLDIPDFAEYLDANDLDSRPTLFSFSYGAAASDWKLWEVHPGDQYAGHFWAMIEQTGFPPECEGFCGQEMPGGWIEDC